MFDRINSSSFNLARALNHRTWLNNWNAISTEETSLHPHPYFLNHSCRDFFCNSAPIVSPFWISLRARLTLFVVLCVLICDKLGDFKWLLPQTIKKTCNVHNFCQSLSQFAFWDVNSCHPLVLFLKAGFLGEGEKSLTLENLIDG